MSSGNHPNDGIHPAAALAALPDPCGALAIAVCEQMGIGPDDVAGVAYAHPGIVVIVARPAAASTAPDGPAPIGFRMPTGPDLN